MPDASPEALLAAEADAVLGTRDVTLTRLAHGQRIGVTAGVWRVSSGERQAVVKVVSPGQGQATWRGSHDPDNYRYWAREPQVYEVGLPAGYREAGVVLPDLLGRFDRPGGDVSLWLHDVSGAGGSSWTVARTEKHARRIGRAQGRCLDGRGWSEQPVPWSRSMLRDYLDTPEATSADIDWAVLDEPGIWDSPLVERHFGGDLRAEVLQLCRQRYDFVRWGSLLPQTLCHHDLWPNNLFEYEDRTVVVDWAFAGAGWLGADVGNYVSDAALDLLRPTEELPALDRAVFRGYCEGLRDVGWTGDERAVRLGMCLVAAKWTWLIPVMLERARSGYQHTVYGSQEVDADRLYAERASVFRMLVAWAGEARALAAELLVPDAR